MLSRTLIRVPSQNPFVPSVSIIIMIIVIIINIFIIEMPHNEELHNLYYSI